MKKQAVSALALSLALTLFGCGASEETPEETGFTVVATTYPVYLAARTVADGVEGVVVERLNTGEVSCLHDYTLTVGDMKKLDRADVVAMSGVELEAFMEDALASSHAAVIDCSEGIPLLESVDHVHEETEGGHDHGHFDPHYWMDPKNMGQIAANVESGLIQADPAHEAEYRANGREAAGLLEEWDGLLRELFQEAQAQSGAEVTGLVTFHDGFQYFAQAIGVPLLAAIEEEEGSEASAKEINEITALVKEYDLPVIFAEVNGSDATANAISRETGCAVGQLSMLMDGPAEGTLEVYYVGMRSNLAAVVNGFAGREVILAQ